MNDRYESEETRLDRVLDWIGNAVNIVLEAILTLPFMLGGAVMWLGRSFWKWLKDGRN